MTIAGACLIGFLYYRPVHAYVRTRHVLTSRKAEVQALAAQKRALEKRLADSDTEASVLRAARMLGYVKPGERLVIVTGIADWRRRHAAARAQRRR